jgi:galactose-1-phosphate uridylyltransferase family 2
MGKTFLLICRYSEYWTGYTATPGDQWKDFIAYFTATGCVRNKTDFLKRYAIMQSFRGFPEIKSYLHEDELMQMWEAFIFAETDGTPHNTITPIARMRNGRYELDLVLRNNITTDEHPLGVFHPHAQLHHIKKENIGLIEVMGLAVLPARLKDEMKSLKDAILNGRDLRSDEVLEKHADWVDEFSKNYDKIDATNIDTVIQDEIGKVFMHVLEDAGVYKRTPEGQKAFDRFVTSLN